MDHLSGENWKPIVHISEQLGVWNLLPEFQQEHNQAKERLVALRELHLEGKLAGALERNFEARNCGFWLGLGYLDPSRQRFAVATFYQMKQNDRSDV